MTLIFYSEFAFIQKSVYHNYVTYQSGYCADKNIYNMESGLPFLHVFVSCPFLIESAEIKLRIIQIHTHRSLSFMYGYLWFGLWPIEKSRSVIMVMVSR